jgi:hypothetical protein
MEKHMDQEREQGDVADPMQCPAERRKAYTRELEAILLDITYENDGQVHVGYREYVDLAEKWPVLRTLHLQNRTESA